MVLSQKYCCTQERHIALQLGLALQYNREMCCRVLLASRLISQKGAVAQMWGILPYKWEVHCSTSSGKGKKA